MHPPEIRAEALALVEQGLNDCEISRRLGVPRRTIMDWRRPTYVPRRTTPIETCPRCWRAAKPMRFAPADYSALLGTYLGDGSISSGPRTMRLRIALDAKYPRIIEETRALLDRCFPANSVDVIRKNLKGKCVNVSTYSNHLPCLFPQHGAGPKHRRKIVLEPWQSEIIDAQPWAFIRACIWTDGCAFINRTDVHRPKPYEYLSYHFANMSKDIIDLFVEACGRVNRRESVALMEQNVGIKR